MATDIDEVITHKRLRVSGAVREPFWVQPLPFLAESLVANLISNAIRCNQATDRTQPDTSRSPGGSNARQ